MPQATPNRISRKVSIMHQMWDNATADLTTAQMNHHDRPGVLPISFSLLHYVSGEDQNISHYLLDAPTHWESGAWAERVGGNFPAVKRGTPVDIAETVQLGGAEAWIEYQRGVFSRTESALAAMGADDFDRVVHEGIPAQVQGSFVGFMAAPNGPVYLGDVIDGFVFQHGIRHLGEIEHAQSLLGLQGVS